MVRVYSDALLTIAADAAENSDAGFFNGSRKAIRSQTRQLSTPHQIFARPESQYSYKGGSVSHRHPGTRKSYLSDRGWTLQENLLSPRTLHFTEAEITWECASATRCECRDPHPNNRAGMRPRDRLEGAEGW